PGAHRGASGENVPGIHLTHGSDVIEAVGPAALEHREAVGVFGNARIPVGDPEPALPVPLPRPLGRHQRVVRRAHRRDRTTEGGKGGGGGWPASFSSVGFGWNRWRCDGPLSMNSQMTDFAVAGWCGPRALSSCAANTPSSASIAASAIAPKPPPACARNSRR